MHSHFTSILFDLTELTISCVENVHDDYFIYIQPIEYLQSCPHCQEKNIIRKGSAYVRKVRHLPAFGHRVFLLMPAIRMMCKHREASFVWQYECVAPGKRYTKQFEVSLPIQVVGAEPLLPMRLNKLKLQLLQWNVFIKNGWKLKVLTFKQ